MRKILLMMLLVLVAIGLIACGNSVDEGDSLLSTPIGDFTYTLTYSNTHEDMTANSGYTFLVVELIPHGDKGISVDTIEDFPMGDTKVILNEDTFEAIFIQERFSADDLLSQTTIVYVVEESLEGEEVEIVLP